MGEPSKGTFEPYNGPSGAFVGESPFFTYADIVPPHGESEQVVVIEQVRARKGVRFHVGQAKPVELFLKFEGIEKELRVNVSIRRALDKLYGTDTGNWAGKPIALFVQSGIKVKGEEVQGVRVRDKVPPMPTVAWSKKAALEELMRPENRAATKAAAERLGIKVEKSGDLLALPDEKVREIEKAMDDAREPGAEG